MQSRLVNSGRTIKDDRGLSFEIWEYYLGNQMVSEIEIRTDHHGIPTEVMSL